MKINSKLFLSFSVMAVLLAGAGYFANSQVTKVASSFDVVKEEATPSIIALGNIKSNFNALHAAVLAFNLHVPDAATDPEVKQTALDHLEEVNMQKQKLLGSVEEYRVIESESPESRITTRVTELVAHIDEMTLLGTAIMNESPDGVMAEEGTEVPAGEAGGHAGHAAAGGATANESPIIQLHGMILELNEEAMMFNEELEEKIDEKYASLTSTQGIVLNDIQGSINMNVILTIAAVSIVFAVGGLAAYSITKRVKQLKNEAHEVSTGNLSAVISTPGSDEIADLASNFENMRQSLVAAQEELSSKNKNLQNLNAKLQSVNADLDQANQDLKKLDKLKDQFIGIASHELRGPIHPILGYASMGKSGKIQPQVALDVIHKQALKLRQLASDILDVSRMDSGNMSFNMQSVKIHELLLNALIAAGGTVNPENVSIVAKIDEQNKDLEILADKDRIGQVFTNILGNAVKFTKKGSITTETHINPASKTFEILVSDTGGGIPQDILPNLFGKFVTKNVGDTNKEGTGLGLYISKAIITAHGGTIDAYNSNGGATFKIILPIGSGNGKAQTQNNLVQVNQ